MVNYRFRVSAALKTFAPNPNAFQLLTPAFSVHLCLRVRKFFMKIVRR